MCNPGNPSRTPLDLTSLVISNKQDDGDHTSNNVDADRRPSHGEESRSEIAVDDERTTNKLSH